MQENSIDYIPLVNLGVYKTNINHLDFKNLISFSYKIKETSPLVAKSNQGGYQSENNINQIPDFFSLIKDINKICYNITKNPNKRIKKMWVNISSFGNYNIIHTHNSNNKPSLLSGVLYLKIPKNSGFITFYNPLDINSHEKYFPKVGDLLIFPQYLPHSVEPNLSKEDRISIAFNYE
jgi:hypothetical protein